MADVCTQNWSIKKGGCYFAIATHRKVGTFTLEKVLCFDNLTGIEPYYIQCIKDGHFQLKIVEGANNLKHNSQMTRGGSSIQTNALKASLYHAYQMIYIDVMSLVSKNEGLVAETFDWDEQEVSDDDEMTQVKVLMALADEELVNILLSMDEDADWKAYLKYINIDLKFVEEKRILVPESQAINECLKLTEATTNPESSKESGSESQTPLPPLKVLQGASPSSEILKANAKPFPPCIGFNDYRPDDYHMYHECEICGSNDHTTSGHNCVILARGGIQVESYQSSESLVGVSCNTYGSVVHSTTNHSDFKISKEVKNFMVLNQRAHKEVVSQEN
ncbi:hypothetical protein Tco_0713053 [Tanacetum coccineum]